MTDNNDDDLLQLSAATFAALQEFYEEQTQKEKKLEETVIGSCNSIAISEDWQLSQFWYDENTVDTLVKSVLKIVGLGAKIALISCPSLYPKMKKLADNRIEVTLFEYDQRFALHGSDFILYDYKFPLDIPRHLSSYYDIVIADPPFLSEECLTKTAVTMKFLTKEKIILCTGEVMSDLAHRLLDVKKCNFKPGHVNNLANEFCCYANFNFNNFIEQR